MKSMLFVTCKLILLPAEVNTLKFSTFCMILLIAVQRKGKDIPNTTWLKKKNNYDLHMIANNAYLLYIPSYKAHF